MVHSQSGSAGRIDHASVLCGGNISEAAIFDEGLHILLTANENGAGRYLCTGVFEDAIGNVQRLQL